MKGLYGQGEFLENPQLSFFFSTPAEIAKAISHFLTYGAFTWASAVAHISENTA
jgi:hypothetical protein